MRKGGGNGGGGLLEFRNAELNAYELNADLRASLNDEQLDRFGLASSPALQANSHLAAFLIHRLRYQFPRKSIRIAP
ncbi:hypothetical protein ACHAXN_008120 [Cyclotella atomus]